MPDGKSEEAVQAAWADWPEELYVDQVADVEWIKASNDPLVWHAAALACLIFRGDEHGLLPWLAKQPNLDRVTAATMFLSGGNGERYLTGQALNFHRLSEEQTAAMIEALCDLDEAHLLRDNGIGLFSEWETARQETLGRLPKHPDLPLRFLQDPIDRQTAEMPYYDIGEGDLMAYRITRDLYGNLWD